MDLDASSIPKWQSQGRLKTELNDKASSGASISEKFFFRCPAVSFVESSQVLPFNRDHIWPAEYFYVICVITELACLGTVGCIFLGLLCL